MFSQYCAQPFHVERVLVEEADGSKTRTPELRVRCMTVDAERMARVSGVSRTTAGIAEMLERMGLTSLENRKVGRPSKWLILKMVAYFILFPGDWSRYDSFVLTRIRFEHLPPHPWLPDK